MIPAFYDGHFLPDGDHDATWYEVQQAFGNTERRRHLCLRMSSFILASKRCGFKAVYLFGSFISGKPEPGDIDLLWVYPSAAKATMAQECQDLLNYGKMKDLYGWDMFCCSEDPMIVAMLLAGWRTNKTKTKQRGIIRIDLQNYEGLIL